MFPLKKKRVEEPSPVVHQNKQSVSFKLPQLKNGQHNENYTIYRTTASTPHVLNRMIQRGASVVGISESALHYAIRWLESKANEWRIGQYREGLKEATRE